MVMKLHPAQPELDHPVLANHTAAANSDDLDHC